MKYYSILLLVLLSCNTMKNKTITERKTTTSTSIDSVGNSKHIVKSDSITTTENDCWEWAPTDSTSTTPVTIVKSDGSIITIPVAGHLKHSKQSKHISILDLKIDSSSVKKITKKEDIDYAKNKIVTRKSNYPIWIIITLLIIGACVYDYNRK